MLYIYCKQARFQGGTSGASSFPPNVCFTIRPFLSYTMGHYSNPQGIPRGKKSPMSYTNRSMQLLEREYHYAFAFSDVHSGRCNRAFGKNMQVVSKIHQRLVVVMRVF